MWLDALIKHQSRPTPLLKNNAIPSACCGLDLRRCAAVKAVTARPTEVVPEIHLSQTDEALAQRPNCHSSATVAWRLPETGSYLFI